MRLLITGSTGFIGRRVLAEALDRGHDVVALVYKTEPPESATGSDRLRSFRFELGGRDRLDLGAFELDGIVHLAGALAGDRKQSRRVIIDGSRQIVEAARRAGIEKMVGVSSIASLDYDALPAMSIIDESAPVIDFRDCGDSYATLKAEQEAVMGQFCAENRNHLVIIRPGLVYDADNLNPAHAGIVRASFGLLASHDGQVPLIGNRDLAQAIVDAVELDAAGREIIHLLGDDLPTQKEYIRELRRRNTIGAFAVTIPWRVFWVLAAAVREGLTFAGAKSRVPELFTRAGFAGRLKPFRFSNAHAQARLKRSFACEL